MQETVAGEYRTADLEIAPAVRENLSALASRVRERSLIDWGEHCSECSYPACYATCDFYTPRPDLHCRRFEGGIESVPGAAARLIRSRRWGKLEGHGPARLRPQTRAQRVERIDSLASRVQSAAPF